MQRPGEPRRRGPEWTTATCVLLLLALALVIGFAMVKSSGGRLSDAAAPIVAEGADMVATEGAGQRDGRAFVLDKAGAEGISVLTAKLSPFAAEEFSRIEWQISSAQPPPELALLWRTREHPRRNYTKRVQWLVGGAAPLDLSAEDGWSGTITGVGLVVAPGLQVPLRVESLRIASRSAAGVAGTLAQEWTQLNPLGGYSVNFPFDAERGHELPLLPAVAAAVALAIALYLLLARWRGWPRDRRVAWAIVVGGWLLLDLRWQTNLWREAAARGARFAGKTTAEKHLAADDAALFALAEKVQSALPAAPTRIFLYCDSDLLCARAAFLIYPRNPYRSVSWRRPVPARPEDMHAGEYVLLLYSRALGYDAARQVIVWPDGHTKPADVVLTAPGTLLARVR